MSETIKECMLTTIDNPFDPFEQFDDWLRYDEDKGYYSSSKLARLVQIPEDATQQEENQIIEEAIDNFIVCDPLGLYIKATKK